MHIVSANSNASTFCPGWHRLFFFWARPDAETNQSRDFRFPFFKSAFNCRFPELSLWVEVRLHLLSGSI
jgi:hypothetical protein